MLFCCLWRNVETSRHKHFVVISRYQQTPPLTTSDKCHNLRDRGSAARVDNAYPVAALTSHSEARYRLRIAISTYSTCIRRPRRNIAMHWYGKTKLFWLPDGEDTFIRFDIIHERDRHTHIHTQTPHDG